MVFDLGNQFYACGRQGLPKEILLKDGIYKLRKIFKHDFFAATGLYENESEAQNLPRKLIVKISREENFLIFGLSWFGKILRDHEMAIYERLAGIMGIPRIISEYGRSGLIYEYIEGQSLDENPNLPADFFEKLRRLINQVHSRKVAYVDLNKRGNIILGKNSKPYLIDFQISVHMPAFVFARLLNALQRADIYHLYKHKRKLTSHLLDENEYTLSEPGYLIRLHRLIANPYKIIRRLIFRYLYETGILAITSGMRLSRENDPSRFFKN